MVKTSKTPKVETPKVETTIPETPKVETTIPETPKVEMISTTELAIPATNLGRESFAGILSLEMLRLANGFRSVGFIPTKEPLEIVPIPKGQTVTQYQPAPVDKIKIAGEEYTLTAEQVASLTTESPRYEVISGSHRTLAIRLASILWGDAVPVPSVPCIILTAEDATAKRARSANRRAAHIETDWSDKLQDASDILDIECTERALWQGCRGALPVYATRGEAIGAFAAIMTARRAGKSIPTLIKTLKGSNNTPSQLIAQRIREKLDVSKTHTLLDALTPKGAKQAWAVIQTPRSSLVRAREEKPTVNIPERTANTPSQMLLVAMANDDRQTVKTFLDYLDNCADAITHAATLAPAEPEELEA